MSCISLNGGYLPTSCKAQAGVAEFVIYDVENVATQVFSGDTNHEITSFTLDDGAYGYRFKVESFNSSWESTPSGNRENSSTAFDQSVVMIINDNEKETINTLNILSKMRKIGVFTKGLDGYWRSLGTHNGLQYLGGLTGSGTAMSDRNGSEVVMSGQEGQHPEFISATLVEAILEA